MLRCIRAFAFAVPLCVLALAAGCNSDAETAEQPATEDDRPGAPAIPTAALQAPPVFAQGGPQSSNPAPRSSFTFPEIGAFEGESDFRDVLPIGRPLSPRDYIEAIEEEGFNTSFQGQTVNLCRFGGPQAVTLDVVDDQLLGTRVMIWAYQAPEDVGIDWEAGVTAADPIVLLDRACHSASVLADQLPERTWVVENLVVWIRDDPPDGHSNELLEILWTLAVDPLASNKD